ncbi:hypothetical protein GCM10009641_02340 [Mycobacterium cookii]|uniref:Uncharacterized protein n=1 Tax=Mycobacterium cookii TaxID=1775 RepID=A0A7I7L2V8_9MYCO|nr:hypothetical protein [Mycobacterium cookii]MCV7329448.1 hypothetical protein [Mycobacterium cookii]BBX48720.1 hypothetical protein MCOO_47350 [Mycobacterium cookii]
MRLAENQAGEAFGRTLGAAADAAGAIGFVQLRVGVIQSWLSQDNDVQATPDAIQTECSEGRWNR